MQTVADRSTVPVTLRELPPARVGDQAEAVANVHKHAHASSIAVTVAYRMPWLRLSVGRGGADEHAGPGLAGLRERVEALGGESAVHGSSRGTEAAVAAVATTHPDLVLIDIRMPGMGGVAAGELIAAASPGTAVVMITADSGSSDRFPVADKRSLAPAAPIELWQASRRR